MTLIEPSVKKYNVRLSPDERDLLAALVGNGKRPARKLLKARILLKADISEAGEGWSDGLIADALDGPVATCVGIVWRVFGRDEAIRSCGEVNDLIDGFLGEALPSVDLAHGDLP